MTSSLQHRMDTRTIEEFASHIRKTGENEVLAAYALTLFLAEKHSSVSFQALGNDNTKAILINGNALPDFKFNINGKSYQVEIKVHSSKYKGIRFKQSCMKAYVEAGAFVAVIQEHGYTIIIPTELQAISETPASIYAKFSPNDPCHYVSADQLETYTQRSWNFAAWEIINIIFQTNRHPAYEL